MPMIRFRNVSVVRLRLRLSFSFNSRSFRHSGAWLLLLVASTLAGQNSSVSSYHDPADLVRKAVANEIKAANDETTHLRFRGTKTSANESTTRIYIETQEATLGLIVANNGIPLTEEQRRAEQERVKRFIDHPEELKRKHEQERANADHSMRIMRALPEAFLYENAGEEMGSAVMGRAGAPLVKLKFRPNPNYQPPTRVEEVLTGMQGYVLVDPVRNRLASIDGTLFKEVSFGWGILGHLNPGGRFLVQQQEVMENLWAMSSLTLNFTGKLLLFKSLTIDSKEIFSDFKPVPSNLTFTQAVALSRGRIVEARIAERNLRKQELSKALDARAGMGRPAQASSFRSETSPPAR